MGQTKVSANFIVLIIQISRDPKLILSVGLCASWGWLHGKTEFHFENLKSSFGPNIFSGYWHASFISWRRGE